MHNSKAAAQPRPPAASTPMYGAPAYGVPASSAGSGAGGYVYPAATNSAGYGKIPNYPAPPSSASYPATVPSAILPPQQPASAAQQAPIHDPTAPPSPLAKAAELVTRFREQGQALIAARRPWVEVFRAPAFSRPPSLGEALARMRRNTAYFRANYALVVVAVVAASLLWHPGTLFALVALCAAWFFLYFARPAQGGQPLRIFGTEFDDGTVLAALCGVTVIAMLFTNVGWNVIGSVLIGGLLVGAHAALRTTDDLFLTEQEAAGDGLVAASISAAGPILPTYVRIA
ncbi:hypothetical protein PR202_ga13412 [Eleusine coracana subsp. coracana]|uniref:PRA1 family protein n=1 Tax=Eleusine coracana subsp. coracana TaxID=191504 RepID=A0AAV5CE33_ELECO|nr:hypothetical protein PR202_ga13412 [Eleusine coracana subsp. coracana]